MAIFHCQVKIGGKADGKSAVASAAYRAGESLTRTLDNTTKDFSKKGGVVHSEIMLPEHAPERYRDREKLWNDVEKTEKTADAQLYREFEIALPRELNRAQQIEAAREFCRELNRQGMITDLNIHDKNDGNPHAHIMCPVRQLDKNGEWALKEKRGYALDENGNKIPVIDPATGQQKIGARGRKMWQREKSQKNPWNDRGNVDKWRETWERVCNSALERAGSSARIDRRSHAARGIKYLPQIHEGARARALERKGGASRRVAWNTRIKSANAEMKVLDKEERQITSLKKNNAAGTKGAGKAVGDVKGAAGKVATAPLKAAGKLNDLLKKCQIATPKPSGAPVKDDDFPWSALTKSAQQEKLADHKFDEDWDADEGESLKGNVSYIDPEEGQGRKKKDEEGDQQKNETRKPERKQTPEEEKKIREAQKAHREAMKAKKAAESGKLSKSELKILKKQMEALQDENIIRINDEVDAIEKAASDDYIKKSPLSKELKGLEKMEVDARTKFDLAKQSTAKAQAKFDALMKAEPKQNIFNKLLGESAEHKAWAKQIGAAQKNLVGAQTAEAAAGKNFLKSSNATGAVNSQLQAGAKAAGAAAKAAVCKGGKIGGSLTTPVGAALNAALTTIQITISAIKMAMKFMDEMNKAMEEVPDRQREVIEQSKVLTR